ncbi:threonine/serine dehydratase [Actinomycetes bacterium M1A6_2h]
MIGRDDVVYAADRIRGFVRRTPSIEVSPNLVLKCEFLQHTGSFKARGAFNRVLTAHDRGELDPAVGVVAASGGNAGLANAFAARAVGVPCTVFVPETAPATKVERLHAYGAVVHQVGTEFAEAFDAATDFATRTGAVVCHPYDQLEVAAGAGTIAEEILSDDPGVDTIVLSVGGGGLYAGVAASAAGHARVVAVEPRTIPTLHSALAAGTMVDVPVSGVAADSLGARRVGTIAFEVATASPPISVLVDDAAIVDARNYLWSEFRIAAEHGAATAVAGLLTKAYVPADGERVAVIVCGANTDVTSVGHRARAN